jgi:hypothetical protein
VLATSAVERGFETRLWIQATVGSNQKLYIKVRENRSGNKEWTIQKHWQY